MKSYEEVCKELGIAFDNYKNSVLLIVICFYNIISCALADKNLNSKEENLKSHLSNLFLLLSKAEIDDILKEIEKLNGDKDVLNIMKNAAQRVKGMKG